MTDRREYFKRYHAANRERRCARMRERYRDLKELRESWRLRGREWYRLNREKKLAAQKRWYELNKEYRSEWHKMWWVKRGKFLKFRKEAGRFPLVSKSAHKISFDT